MRNVTGYGKVALNGRGWTTSTVPERLTAIAGYWPEQCIMRVSVMICYNKDHMVAPHIAIPINSESFTFNVDVTRTAPMVIICLGTTSAEVRLVR